MKKKIEEQTIRIESKLMSSVILLKEKLSQMGVSTEGKSLLIKGDEITIK